MTHLYLNLWYQITTKKWPTADTLIISKMISKKVISDRCNFVQVQSQVYVLHAISMKKRRTTENKKYVITNMQWLKPCASNKLLAESTLMYCLLLSLNQSKLQPPKNVKKMKNRFTENICWSDSAYNCHCVWETH